MPSETSPPAQAGKVLHRTWRAGRAFLASFGLDGFLLALLGVIGLAYLFPAWGQEGSAVPFNQLTTYGVALIFFFYGLRLNPAKLRADVSNWRLHLVVQGSTFILFPGLILAFRALFGDERNELLWLGAFYLAALPSTVSSSVVMVSIAGGNLPAAIFNASISSLLGVFLTPWWLGAFLTTQTDSAFDFWPVIGKLAGQVLLPVTLGILLHARFGAWAEQHRPALRVFDQTIILVIVFTSFCESFARQLFGGFAIIDLVLLSLGLSGLFFLVYGIIQLGCRALGFGRENQITALFCGSKKSLVHGTVMSKVLFPDVNTGGIILLPLMLYHALQLIFASMLAQALARRANNP